jgi:hypothetical protein
MIDGLIKHDIEAKDLQSGDFLDCRGGTRIHTVLPRQGGEFILIGFRRTGTRSGDIRGYASDDRVRVWRKGGGKHKA